MTKLEEAMKKLQLTASAGGASRAVRVKESERDYRSLSLTPATEPLKSRNALIVKLDRDALRKASLVGPESDERLLADQFRLLKRPLIAHALGRMATPIPDGNLVQVTSSLAGEGKTFISLNLALSMSREQDTSVLLVDGDVLSPALSTALGLDSLPGLLDFLANPDCELESVVYATNIANLMVMPAGRPRHDAAELLSSERMGAFVDVAARAYPEQLVLLDSPPMLVTSESRALAAWSGQLIMVVNAGKTPQQAVVDAVDAIPEDKPVNVVLNRSQRRSSSDSSYGYGGYGHGYGASPKSEGERAE